MFTKVLVFLTRSSDLVFWSSALFGTTLFVLRLLMFILGLGDDADSVEHDHAGVDGDDVSHHATGSFKLLTMHSISGFFMMLGWVGLACVHQLSFSSGAAALIGLAAGLLVMVLTALIFRWARVLTSPGTRFDIRNTVGLTGTVYQQIPTGGQGKIHVVVDGVTRELLAQSADCLVLPSFSQVTIQAVVDHEVVTVVALPAAK